MSAKSSKIYLLIIVLLLVLLLILIVTCRKVPVDTGDLVPPSPGEPVAAGSCNDYVINGLGDCDDFLAACGTGGGHAHATPHSGVLGHITYTCHAGRHTEGD